MTAHRRKLVRSKTIRRVVPLSDELVANLNELLPIGAGEPPTQVIALVRRKGGAFYRMYAEYPNGFTLRVNFDATGKVSSYSANIHLVQKLEKAA